jgi:AraC-like DNA-binding protein
VTVAETALSRLTRGLVHRIAATPAAKRELATRTGLPAEALAKPLGDRAAHVIWTCAEELTNDPDIGLHFAEQTTFEDMGVVAYLGRASATFGEACTRVALFHRLCKEAADLKLTVSARAATLIDVPLRGEPPWPRQLSEAVMVSWLVWPSRWAGVACRPVRVRLQHARPRRADEHARLFGCPVEFGAPVNQLSFTRKTWELPLTTADGFLVQYLEALAADETRRLREADPFVARLEHAMLQLMPGGSVESERLARSLGVSRRTLHRRLAERGLKYQGVLDELRRRTARALLERREHNLTEVAFLIGYSDPSGFRRALRRWELGVPAS